MATKTHIGGKATSLHFLTKNGFNVPPFVVFNETEIKNLTEQKLNEKMVSMHSVEHFAVRSSANVEDGLRHSFAGQFETKLYVKRTDLLKTIQEVHQSKFSERVQTYLAKTDISTKDLELAIIVQEMIESDFSGVGFSKNPTKPYKNEQVISSVFGLGEGLVSGALAADTFIRKNNGHWQKTIAHKNEMFIILNHEVAHFSVPDEMRDKSSMNDTELNEVSAILSKLEKLYGCPQDIEFCYQNNQLYLLQSRPITTIDKNKQHIIWDNSNIVESYPGITLPFTFSFILEIYESVYFNFGKMLGVPKTQLEANKEVFAEMLGHIKGRVYYHLINWYKALAMLPAYQLNAQYMEKMMGVSEPLGVEFTLKKQPTKAQSYLHLAKMVFNLLKTNWQLPKRKKEFTKKINHIISDYKKQDYGKKKASEIWADYGQFKKLLVNEWTPPLANDLFAMIYFGTLEKLSDKWLHQPGLHTDLVIGKYPLKSVEPAKMVNQIIETAIDEDKLNQLKTSSEKAIWLLCQTGQFGQTGTLIMEYIQQYGDRSIGELKLENETFTQNPESFIAVLKSYNKAAEGQKVVAQNAEEVSKHLPFWKRKIFCYVANKAAETVSDRENLRFDRTFGFGTVRMFLWEMGKKWQEQEILNHHSDIFYLSEKEIDLFLGDKLTTVRLQKTISDRKKEFAEYSKIESLPARIHEYGEEFDLDDDSNSTEGQLHGIPCCAGELEAAVSILSQPNEVKSLNGNILVTTSTDPGWITIFQSASGIVVERGSTLSHAAIVSRELGIPCIVGVKGITKLLKNGDLIKMNGKTGVIEQK
ncbi:MAG: phosphoenolpyruvate synthase [Flavobacteriales bacterium]|nr:phosphoenolpyruvate synthase [Flavobacteriales bacterium]